MAQPPHDPSNFEAKVRAATEFAATEGDPRFASDEMVSCLGCSRKNPPDRASCMYCGKPLEPASIRTDLVKINYQQPEAWQDGYSLVYCGSGVLSTEIKRSAAELLETDVDNIQEVLREQIPRPLIYMKSLPDAGLLGSRLSSLGFDCAIVGDDLLQAKVPPTRVGRLSFEGTKLILRDFNRGNDTAIEKEEPVLLVIGNIVKTSFAASGKVVKRTMKAMDESQTVSDELVLDIYPPSDVYGFRIRSSGFDFSCLGARMKPIATGNMVALIGELKNWLTAAKFVETFRSMSPLLDPIWPPDEIKRSSQVARGPLGGVRKQSVTVLDNTIQFTKFSRLQRHFL